MGDQTMETHFDWDPETKTFIRGPREFYYYRGSTNGIPGFLDDQIRMYPNPTDGILNVTGLARNSKIRIYSSLGILVKALDSFDGQIDLGDLPAGMYFIHFVQVGHSPEILAIIKK
jgi:hypothetical protein